MAPEFPRSIEQTDLIEAYAQFVVNGTPAADCLATARRIKRDKTLPAATQAVWARVRELATAIAR